MMRTLIERALATCDRAYEEPELAALVTGVVVGLLLLAILS